MSDELAKNAEQMQDKQSEPQQSKFGKAMNLIIGIAVFIAIVYFVLQSPGRAGRIGIVILGFGAVVFIHELGHFIVAKLGGIKVEAFSIGFPPTILAVRKLKKGWRVRFLPHTGPEPEVEEGDDETEYWLGLIPVGGFVKMLGQSDSGVAEASDDPRSYMNKPIRTRIAVVAAGVTFNAISAIILFMGLYLYGLPQQPALIGGVQPGSPAEAAGLRPGDRIVAIDDKSFLGDFVDYTTVALAGALSDPGQPVKFDVRRADGSEEEIEIAAENPVIRTTGLRSFGIEYASTLQIDPKLAKYYDPNSIEKFYEKTRLRPGDEVIAVEGKQVEYHWELEAIVRSALKREIEFTISRSHPDTEKTEIVKTTLPLVIGTSNPNFRNQHDLSNVYSMVPRLKVEAVYSKKQGFSKRLLSMITGSKPSTEPKPDTLTPGDVILRAGDVIGPTLKEVSDLCQEYKDKPLELEVFRDEQVITFTQAPRLEPNPADPDKDRWVLGFASGLDLEHATIAKTIDTPGRGALNIPAGAQIVKAGGQSVESFYDLIEVLRTNSGQRVVIDYRTSSGNDGSTALEVPTEGGVGMRSFLAMPIPFALIKDPVKTSNPGTAIVLGVKKTKYFIATTYMTFIRLFQRKVPTSSLSGPVGILRVSYLYTQQSMMEFLYFMGLISACLAFMNLLPIPVVDGGVILLLLIEKIKGGPLPEKVHAGIMYAGWIFILAIFVAITYNDIMQLFK